MPITLKDNEQVTIEFKYGNVTKNKSKSGENWYYTFSGDIGGREDRLNLNAYGVKAVMDVWPGRGGVCRVIKRSWEVWEVEVLETAENIYPLEMKMWNPNTKSFDDVPFHLAGLDHDDPQSIDPPKEVGGRADPPAGVDLSPGGAAKGTWNLEDLEQTMGWALQAATRACETVEISGEEAVEKVAVSLYIDARKLGLKWEDPADKETREAGEKMLESHGITQTGTGPAVSMAPDEAPPLPKEPLQPPDEIPLPF